MRLDELKDHLLHLRTLEAVGFSRKQRARPSLDRLRRSDGTYGFCVAAFFQETILNQALQQCAGVRLRKLCHMSGRRRLDLSLSMDVIQDQQLANSQYSLPVAFVCQDKLDKVQVCRSPIEGNGHAHLGTVFVAGRAAPIAQLAFIDDVDASARSFYQADTFEAIGQATGCADEDPTRRRLSGRTPSTNPPGF